MKYDKFHQELRSIWRKLEDLSKEISNLKLLCEDILTIEKLIQSRGIKIFKKNPEDRLIFPPSLSDTQKNRFYEMMKKYSFRLLLRDIIKKQNQFRIDDLTHYCSQRVAKRYCHDLYQMGIILRKHRGIYKTTISPIYSFGPTLEWFIAEMFKREFSSPAIYGVSLKKTSSGGDYDVISSWNQRLIYVEVKSSPPKGIELGEITTFFSRIEDLLPDIAILFNDTQLRMKDKLVVMFEEELFRRYGKNFKKIYPVERLVEELFHIKHRIFIINSKKDVVENFKICLNDYLRNGGRLR